MQIPTMDRTGYCRLCFSQQQLRWLLQSNDNPMVAQIQSCLGVALTPEVDFPCTVCRVCWAALETFEALRERAMACDEALRNNRVGEVPPSIADFEVVECKEERASPEPVFVIEEVSSVEPEEPSVSVDTVNSSSDRTVNGSNTIMIGDIKVELLNVQKGVNSDGTKAQPPQETSPRNRTFGCRQCGQKFDTNRKLQNHMYTMHSHQLTAADMAAAVAVNRLRHPQKRPGEFKPISPKEIRKQMNMYSGDGQKPGHYTCNVCNAQFAQWHTFIRHRKTHDNEKKSDGQAGESNVPNASVVSKTCGIHFQ